MLMEEKRAEQSLVAVKKKHITQLIPALTINIPGMTHNISDYKIMWLHWDE